MQNHDFRSQLSSCTQVFDFSLKTIWEAKKSRAIPAYFPSSASSLSRLRIQQAPTYTAHLSRRVTLSVCLFMFRNSQLDRQVSCLTWKIGDGGGVLTSSRAICLTWPLAKIKHNNMSQSHSERWRSQENRSCLSQLLSFSALNYDSYYLLTGFSTLRAGSKHSKSSRSLLQRTDRQVREENLSWSYSNLLLHVWSERSDILTTLDWLLPSAEPRLQSCTAVLSSAELNCQTLMAKMFPA